MNRQTDIIIIGSGPAGISTGLHLQRLKPDLIDRTIILEKSCHPREKLCGGGISVNSLTILQSLGITVNVPSVFIKNVRLKYGNYTIDLPEGGAAQQVIRRSEFDKMLANCAKRRGILLHEGERVIRLKRCDDSVIVETEKRSYQGKVVVGADGVSSLLRRGFEFNRGRLGARFLEIVTPVNPLKTQEFMQNVLTIDLSYLSMGLKGYYWDFPCYINGVPHLNRGIMDGNFERRKKINFQEIFRIALHSRGVDLEQYPLQGYSERHFNPDDTFSVSNMLLVGDAAGVDSCFGEGISQALEYGKLAAEEIVLAFKNQDFSFRGYRNRILSSRMGKELNAYRLMAKLFYGKYWRFWLSLLWNNSKMRYLLAESYAGREGFHRHKTEIFSLLLKHLIIGNKKLPELA